MSMPLATPPAMSDTQAAIQAGANNAKPHPLPVSAVYATRDARGEPHLIDLTDDKWLDQPRRVRHHQPLTDVPSLLWHWAKHHTARSELTANTARREITATYDAHAGALRAGDDTDHPSAIEDDFRAGWRQHTATLHMAISRPLQAWLDIHDTPLPQDRFAEHVEDRMAEVADPPAADLLDAAQHLHGTATAHFAAGYKISNGARILQHNEDVAINGGQSGTLAAPLQLSLRLPIWRDDPTPTDVTARLRYRVNAGKLTITTHLADIDTIIDAAFAQVIAAVEAGAGQRVLRAH